MHLRPGAAAMPGQGSRSATSSPIPATPTATPSLGHPARAAGARLVQDLHPPTAAPRAPATARSSATATSTARAHPARCWSSGRSPAPPPKSRPRTGNARPASWPGTSSAASPLMTPTATTGCSAPPPWARSAARSARVDAAGPGPARDPAAPGTSPGLLRPADHHRPAGRAGQDRAETRLPVGGLAPLLRPAHRRRARLRHRKDPASNDIARGWCRLMGLKPLMLFVTTLLVVRNQRILHAWNTRQEEASAAPPPGSPRKPANGAARPSPASPPDRPDPQPATTSAAAVTSTPPAGPARLRPASTPIPQPTSRPRRQEKQDQPRPMPPGGRSRMSDLNVNMVPTET